MPFIVSHLPSTLTYLAHINMESHLPATPTARKIASPILWSGISYWFFFGAIGALSPFLGPYYRQLGLSGKQVGLLSAVPPIAIALLAPLWGALADRRGVHRRVLRLVILPGALMMTLLAYANGFPMVLLLLGLWATCMAPVLPILDSYAVTLSEAHGQSYGRLRLWGTLGYMVSVVAVGWWMRSAPRGSFLFVYVALLLCLLLATVGLPASQNKTSAAGPRLQSNLLALLRKQPALAIVLAVSFLVSIGMSTLGNFFGIYITERGGNSSLIGIANAVLALSEIPIMLWASHLQRKLGNPRLIVLALAAYALRFALYSIVPSAGWIIPIQLLHGLSYAIYLVASIRLVYQLGGKDQAATAQSLLASVMAIGNVVGAFLNGALLDRFGISAIFWSATVSVLVAMVIFLMGYRRVQAATSH